MLERFVRAQDAVWDQVLAELDAAHKQSHWMWFVFPQLRGLGRSDMAWRYGIEDLAEARAYLAHPVLGPRLHTCARRLLTAPEQPVEDILGSIDALKLRSSMTLFGLAAEGDTDFQAVLDRWWGGEADDHTLELLATDTSS
ncbi:MAG: DUF1810 domain-containing protein [Chloroflexi bacterium]|nr:DUF1810 domain-containing protein [Chloroflexota bacterium]